ncbi:MAG: Holliday junction branch migration protein RuvA, partial [Anaerolineales bacterium]
VLVGGVGLRVYGPKTTLDHAPGQSVNLFTHLLVREDALTLYGFPEEVEREVFLILIKINGVGPRLAVAILSTLTLTHLQDAVARENPDVLTRVPGIGKKTAQKIILELKDKIGFQLGLDAAPLVDDLDTDVLETLTTLGYSIVEAQAAIQNIPPDAPRDIEERVRLALQYFA